MAIALLLTTSIVAPHIASAQAVEEGFENPLDTNDISGFIINVIDFLLGLVGLLALLAIIWGGIRLIAAFGSEQQVTDAKKIIKWAIVGLTIVVLSWVIVQIVAREILGAA